MISNDELISPAEEAEHDAVAAAFASGHVISRADPGRLSDLFHGPVNHLLGELRDRFGNDEAGTVAFEALFPVEVKVVQTARWKGDVRIAISRGTLPGPPAPTPDGALPFEAVCDPAIDLYLSCIAQSLGTDFDLLLPLDAGLRIVLASRGEPVVSRTVRQTITGREAVALH